MQENAHWMQFSRSNLVKYADFRILLDRFGSMSQKFKGGGTGRLAWNAVGREASKRCPQCRCASRCLFRHHTQGGFWVVKWIIAMPVLQIFLLMVACHRIGGEDDATF